MAATADSIFQNKTGDFRLTAHQTLLPAGWDRPRGYANGMAAHGRLVFTAGIVGWDERQRFVSEDMVGQFEQVLVNTVAILAEAGARPEHIVRMTWYVTDRAEYVNNLAEIGQIYKKFIGKVFPAMTVVEVTALVEASARIEIETTAVLPDPVS
ncbi:RidA family protein [Pelagerythrobacter aerophilus]|uniref:RidA family protein n=1 Tax=Pelagerythrobacter aerophilus TaxID=2306995 RepID=A0A418ND12_9SPHN|nr:RidA family protein [Pelagerythrobacter aerophilus]